MYIQSKRLDQWASTYNMYVSPGVWRRTGSVYRGMHNLDAAVQYAKEVHEFFAQQGVVPGTVYVVHGPTSTTKLPFEVVDASAGYPVAYKI